MTDDLAIPQVPEAAPDDPEDVSWALSTAEAMWARGDHSEGIKWVRRAAEAASEAENDTRALELAKAAADLAGLIARMSKAAFGDEGGAQHGPPPVPMTRPRSAPPSRGASSSPPAMPQGPSSVTKVVATPSRAASIPLPSKASQPPPPLPTKSVPRTAMRPQAPAPPPSEPVTRTKSSPVAPKSTISNRPPPESQRKGRRKSRENLEGAARTAGLLDGVAGSGPASRSGSGPAPAASSGRLPNDTTEIAAARGTSDRARRQEPDATVVANVKDIMRPRTASRSTDEWDASPTQNLTGDDLAEVLPDRDEDHDRDQDRDRVTRVGRVGGTPEAMGSPRPSVKASPAPSATPRSVRPPVPTKHDPGIVTSQAVRVVVWRDATGVHVAPAGTVVSAITVDAVLVALEEGADLTAWLSQRG